MARILIDAICNGDEELARDIILEKTYGCIDSQTSQREGTALFFCCSRGYAALTDLLLGEGASVHSRNKSNATPLHGAVDNGHLCIVRCLLFHGADINAQTHRGDTPLHLAAYRGHKQIVQCLVEAGADFRLVNANDVTAQNEASLQGYEDIARYLKAVHKLRYPDEETSVRSSMIQLDPPVPDRSTTDSSQLQQHRQQYYDHHAQQEQLQLQQEQEHQQRHGNHHRHHQDQRQSPQRQQHSRELDCAQSILRFPTTSQHCHDSNKSRIRSDDVKTRKDSESVDSKAHDRMSGVTFDPPPDFLPKCLPQDFFSSPRGTSKTSNNNSNMTHTVYPTQRRSSVVSRCWKG